MKFPAKPDDSINDLNGKDLRVRITKDHRVFIGGVELPGLVIEGSLRLETGRDALNKLEVRFVVGEVEIDDEIIGSVPLTTSWSDSCLHENELHVPPVATYDGDPIRLGHRYCLACGRIVYDELATENCG